MKDDTFQELLQGVREGGAYLRGEIKPARVTRVRAAQPKSARPGRAARSKIPAENGFAAPRARLA